MARQGRVVKSDSRFYGTLGQVKTQVSVSPDFANPIENVKFMRAKLIANIGFQLRDRAAYFERIIQNEAPWEDHPIRHGSDSAWPNDIARNNLRAEVFFENDRVGIALFHPDETVYYGSDNYPEGFYYGAVLELGRGPTSEGGRGALAGNHFLRDMMRGDLADMVTRFMAGSALDGMSFKRPQQKKARTIKVSR